MRRTAFASCDKNLRSIVDQPSVAAYFGEFFIVPKVWMKLSAFAVLAALAVFLRPLWDRTLRPWLLAHSRGLLLSVFALACVLRLSWVAVSPHAPCSEEVPMLDMARDLAEGHGFVYQGQPTARRSAGYIFFLSLFYRCGLPLIAIQAMNALLSSLLVPLLYLLGRQIKSPAAGLLAGSLWAIYPTAVFASALVLDEHLCLPLLLLGIFYLAQAMQRPGLRPLLWAGLCWGIGATARPIPSTLPFAAFLALWMTRYSFRQAAGRALLLAAVVLACAAPWALRNWVKLGSPVLYCISQYGFYWANNSSYDVRFPVNPTPQAGEDTEIVRARDLYHAGGRGEIEYSQVTMRKAWEWIRQNPGVFAVKTAGKAFHLLGFSEEEWAMHSNLQALKPGAEIPSERALRWTAIKPQNWFYVLVFLGAMGGLSLFLLQWLRGYLNAPFLLLALCFGQIFAMTILYLAHLKYRYMLDPFLILCCSYFVSCLMRIRKVDQPATAP